jgi:hypothetical protein
MNKPAMMDWALRLLNEKKVLTSRVVAEEFDVNIRTAWPDQVSTKSGEVHWSSSPA